MADLNLLNALKQKVADLEALYAEEAAELDEESDPAPAE